MTFTEYVKTFTPERYVILGVELKPLSLGHYFLMRRFNVGYAADVENRVGWDDLVVAILICSMSYDDFILFIDNKTPDGKHGKCKWLWWKDDPKYFLNTLGREGKKLKKRIKKEKNFNIMDKMLMFSKYLHEGTKMPHYWEGDNVSDKKSGAHWSQSVFTTAISELGYTRTEALNTPLVQLFNDFFKFAENQGAVQLMTEDEENKIKEMETLNG